MKLVFLVLIMVLCVSLNAMADRIFYDNFESKDATLNAWKPVATPIPEFEISAAYNFTKV